MSKDHRVRTIAYDARPTRSQRAFVAALLREASRLYNAALQERIEAYRWACRQAEILGLGAPARWRLIELAHQAGLLVREDGLPGEERAKAQEALAEHKRRWAEKVAAFDEAWAAELARRGKAREDKHKAKAEGRRKDRKTELASGKRPKMPKRPPDMALNLDGARLTAPQKAALLHLLGWSTPDGHSQASAMAAAARDKTYEGLLAWPQRRWVLSRLDDAFRAFFKRVQNGDTPGFPRFRSIRRWKSIGWKEMRGVAFEPDWEGRRCGKLRIKGVHGALRVRQHRPMPDGAEVRSCVVTIKGRKMQVALQARVPVDVAPEADGAFADLHEEEVLGVDGGVIRRAALSNGAFIDAPRPRKAARRKIRLLQRQLARANKNSRRRRLLAERLGAERAREGRRRRTSVHQTGAAVVNAALDAKARAISFEKLNLSGMMASAAGTREAPGKNVRQKAALNDALADSGLGMTIEITKGKAERAGLKVVMVNPRGTSILCSGCGKRVPKALDVRVHKCGSCSLRMDRDVNAAVNIARRGAAKLRAAAKGSEEPSGRADGDPEGTAAPHAEREGVVLLRDAPDVPLSTRRGARPEGGGRPAREMSGSN